MGCGTTIEQCLNCTQICKYDKYSKNPLGMRAQLRDIAKECEHNSISGTARKFKVSRGMVMRALEYCGDKGVKSAT